MVKKREHNEIRLKIWKKTVENDEKQKQNNENDEAEKKKHSKG